MYVSILNLISKILFKKIEMNYTNQKSIYVTETIFETKFNNIQC